MTTDHKATAQSLFVIGFGMAHRDAPAAAKPALADALRRPTPETIRLAMTAVQGHPVRHAMKDALMLIGIEASTEVLEGVDHV